MWPKGSTTYWHQLAEVLKAAGLAALPYNAGRHCFASYLLAAHEDPRKTSLQLGHTKPDLLFNVYRGIHTTDGAPVTRESATAYFEIKSPKLRHGIQRDLRTLSASCVRIDMLVCFQGWQSRSFESNWD